MVLTRSGRSTSACCKRKAEEREDVGKRIRRLEKPPKKRETKPVVDEKQCTICLETVPHLTVLDGCCHQEFCFSCVVKWGNDVTNRCPLCKSKFSKVTRKNLATTAVEEEKLIEEREQRVHDDGLSPSFDFLRLIMRLGRVEGRSDQIVHEEGPAFIPVSVMQHPLGGWWTLTIPEPGTPPRSGPDSNSTAAGESADDNESSRNSSNRNADVDYDEGDVSELFPAFDIETILPPSFLEASGPVLSPRSQPRQRSRSAEPTRAASASRPTAPSRDRRRPRQETTSAEFVFAHRIEPTITVYGELEDDSAGPTRSRTHGGLAEFIRMILDRQ